MTTVWTTIDWRTQPADTLQAQLQRIRKKSSRISFSLWNANYFARSISNWIWKVTCRIWSTQSSSVHTSTQVWIKHNKLSWSRCQKLSAMTAFSPMPTYFSLSKQWLLQQFLWLPKRCNYRRRSAMKVSSTTQDVSGSAWRGSIGARAAPSHSARKKSASWERSLTERQTGWRKSTIGWIWPSYTSACKWSQTSTQNRLSQRKLGKGKSLMGQTGSYQMPATELEHG